MVYIVDPSQGVLLCRTGKFRWTDVELAPSTESWIDEEDTCGRVVGICVFCKHRELRWGIGWR